jgi:PKD repeat protein
MKKAYLLVLVFSFILNIRSQAPCTLSLDSIYLDSSLITCNSLFFKYTISGGTATSFYWDYGDGSNCTCIYPKHFYTKNGTFNVCGRIEDANGCKDSLCYQVTVNCSNPCDLSNLGIYSVDTLSYSCDEVEFITITSNNAKKIVWDFGDGSFDSSKYVIHKYINNGSYTVRLIIRDSISCADTAEIQLDIECEIEDAPCQFKISSIDTSMRVDCKTMHFNLISNTFNKKLIWDYGDGNSSSDDSSSNHTYSDTGKYQVCVIGEDAFACKDTFCTAIIIACNTNSLSNYSLNDITIFPIPFHDVLKISLKCKSNILIYDLQMKLLYVKRMETGENELNLSNIQSGPYLLLLENECGKFYYKIQKE